MTEKASPIIMPPLEERGIPILVQEQLLLTIPAFKYIIMAPPASRHKVMEAVAHDSENNQ